MAESKLEDFQILLPFLQSKDNFISGEELAELTGVSRVSIWNHLKKLEREGFHFKGVRNRGYRLEKEPENLHAALLRAYAHLNEVDLGMHVYNSMDSTSSEVERRLIAGEPPPFGIFASEQTRGRGRLGRSWQSLPAGNLHLSMAFRPTLRRDRMQVFTLWMGVNVAERVQQLTGLPIRIKWPNDILCNEKKLAGILTEARIDNDRLKDLIFGIGINVNAEKGFFHGDLEQKATSLYLEKGKTFALHPFTMEILITLLQSYKKIESEDITPFLLKKWRLLDCLNGRQIMIQNGNQAYSGVADGIDENGALKVITGEKKTVLLRAGDVSLSMLYSSDR